MTNPRLEELRSKFQENPRRYFAPFANELRKAGDPAQAITVCRTHLASQPGHVSGHIVLGQALYEAGETAEAQTVFVTALELDPENLIALRTLGEIAQVKGEFGVARDWYTRLLDADPRNQEVSQLLRDLPVESPPAAFTPPNAGAAVDEPTPKTVHDEIAYEESPLPLAEEPPPTPRFHTSYTGAVPAYDSDRSSEAPPAAPAPEPLSASTDEPFVDLQPSAHIDSEAPEWHAESSLPQDLSPDEVSVGDDAQPAVAASTDAAPLEMPDEFLDFSPPEATAESSPPEALSVVEESLDVTPPTAHQPVEEPADTSVVEPPHAVFAEHGFDGPVNDEIGWLTTPSAAYSDLEAAPEEWYAEIDEAESAETAQEPAAMASEVPEVAAQETEESWFDEPGDTSAAEPVEMSNDDFWLPPELPRVASAMETSPVEVDEPSEPIAASPEAPQGIEAAIGQEEIAAVSLPDDSFASEAPGFAHDEPEPASDLADVHVVAEAAEEAIYVEHRTESDAMSTTADAELVPQAEAVVEEVQEASQPAHASIFDNPPVMDQASVPDQSPASSDANVTPAPFITETLAELYLQQGFKDEALSIYRQLLDRNPANQSLKDRIEAIERTEISEPLVSEDEATERAASQSVRTFFSRLARRQAVTATPPSMSETEAPRPEGGDAPFASAASALANMFAASKPSISDETAASTLAGAYSDPGGRPSRAAERELSLDHLFRDVQPVGSQGASLSLDEFYSTPNATTGSTTEPDEGSEEPAGSDIRQFTAWLEGLRKK